MRDRRLYHYALVFLSILLYIIIGYRIDRHETLPLLATYFSLFFIYLLIIRENAGADGQRQDLWIIASVIFRVVLLFSVPALSDDFYRFIWDGRLIDAGYHPFAEVPDFYMREQHFIPGIDENLYSKLNSKHTFTIYPSFAQLIFWLSVKLSTGSIYSAMVAMKVIVFGFELATIWMLTKVVREFNGDKTAVLLYALNPLVILELTGNLHFEGIMVFFLVAAVYALKLRQRFISSIAWGFSICTKLVPLLFLPLLVRHLGWTKAITQWLLTAAVVIILFVPLLDLEIIHGLYTSLGYYFQRFEFNASIYYLIREIGYLIFGFNIIQFSGPLLALSATAVILLISWRKLPATIGDVDLSIFRRMVWCMFIYLLSTAILHPWYIITLLAISIFTPLRFPLVWTGLIFLSYAGYTQTGFEENLLLVAVEYILVITYLAYETLWKKRQTSSL